MLNRRQKKKDLWLTQPRATVNVKVKNIDRFIELNNDIRNNNIERENQNG